MVLLVTTPAILSALETLSPSSRDELQLPQSPALGSPISHDQVIALARHFTRSNGQSTQIGNKEPEVPDPSEEKRDEECDDNASTAAAEPPVYTLNSLLRGTSVYIPPPPPKPEPSPEYLALKARLQAAAEEEAYNRLISPQSSSTAPGPSPIFSSSSNGHGTVQDTRDDNDPLTPSLVINIFLSVLLCGFSTFWAMTHFQTPAFLSFARSKPVAGTATQTVEPLFVLISIFVGLLVGVAEVVVYAAYLRKVGQARAKERAVKERKEVVRSEEDEVQGSEQSEEVDEKADDNEGVEKEEIWGRGVNRGVRRRVRERWKAENS